MKTEQRQQLRDNEELKNKFFAEYGRYKFWPKVWNWIETHCLPIQEKSDAIENTNGLHCAVCGCKEFWKD